VTGLYSRHEFCDKLKPVPKLWVCFTSNHNTCIYIELLMEVCYIGTCRNALRLWGALDVTRAQVLKSETLGGASGLLAKLHLVHWYPAIDRLLSRARNIDSKPHTTYIALYRSSFFFVKAIHHCKILNITSFCNRRPTSPTANIRVTCPIASSQDTSP
jgi:hypothetical protein